MLSIYVDRSLAALAKAAKLIPNWVWAAFISGAIGFAVAAMSTANYQFEKISNVELVSATANDALPDDSTVWEPMFWWQVPDLSGATWIRARFQLTESDFESRILALRLSGPFSAAIWLNGERIGSKGTPAVDPAAELPGPIDASILLGKGAHIGNNEFLIFVSAHHVGYSLSRLFHRLDVTDYEPDTRRKFTTYWQAITQSGLLIGFICLFVYARQYGEAGRWAYWAAAAGACLVAALAFEISRAVVNYPYNWHGVRQFLIWASVLGFGWTINSYAASRFGVWRNGILFVAAMVTIPVVLVFVSGSGPRTVWGLAVLLMAVIIGLTVNQHRQPGPALTLVGLFAGWIPFMLLRSRDFIDNGIYVLASLSFVVMATDALSRTIGERLATVDSIEDDLQLRIESANVSWSVRLVRGVHAAGNYVEIDFLDGRKELVRAALSAIAESAPAPLMRVHRSHIINIEQARRLRVAPGSRYSLELSDNSSIPVGRKFVKQIRAAMDE